jgi:hypothetical protein
MPQEIRLDAAGRLGKIERTPQGGARIPASLTRSGVIEYRQPDGTMRAEWRPAAEVKRLLDSRSLDSLPAIIGHSAWVTPSNYTSVTKGVVDAGSARMQGASVAGHVAVQDADTLRRCDSGELCDLSLGMVANYTPGKGIVPAGEVDAGKRYDGVQRDLVANHVALLPPGTARVSESGFRFDSLDDPLAGAPVLFSELPAEPALTPQEKKTMPLIVRLDSKEYDCTDPNKALELQAACDKIRQDAKDATSRADKAEGERDGLKTKVTTLETQLADTTRLDGLVAERVKLESAARHVLGDKYDPKGRKNREIQIDVIRHDSKDFTGLGPEGKSATGEARSDDYVTSRFDSVLERVTPAGSIHDLRQIINPATPPAARLDSRDEPRMSASERARQANEEASRNAWRTPRA